MKVKIAGVVILYNPDSQILENISSYINQVDKLYVIDNSEMKNVVLINKIQLLEKAEYIFNDANLGIAAALNIGARKAIQEGFEYLLTMDQDSKVSEDLVEKALIELEKGNEFGIISPFVIQIANPLIPQRSDIEEIEVSITSGNIVRLSAHKEVGGYLEKLFIDYVDYDYCLRMKILGYKVMQLNSVLLYHNLGDIEIKNLIFRKVYPTNHLPLRLYYRTRNRFYVKNIYKKIFPDFFKEDDRAFWKGYLKIVLFERDKIQKIKYIIKGYRDYRRNIFGKYEDVHSK